MSQGLLFIYDFHTYYHTIMVALEMTPLVLKKISQINFQEFKSLLFKDDLVLKTAPNKPLKEPSSLFANLT